MSTDLSNLPTRGYTKKEVQETDFVVLGNKFVTEELDGTTTEEIIRIGDPGLKVTLQTSGDLAINYSFSANGTDYTTPAALAANTLFSYDTHIVSYVKITRTSGTGKTYLIVA